MGCKGAARSSLEKEDPKLDEKEERRAAPADAHRNRTAKESYSRFSKSTSKIVTVWSPVGSAKSAVLLQLHPSTDELSPRYTNFF
jgi:hypothetical protein